MLAVVGFLVGEKVEGSSFLFDASIKGPAISHLAQVPVPFWIILAAVIGKVETERATKTTTSSGETAPVTSGWNKPTRIEYNLEQQEQPISYYSKP
mmetsp:Transcript_778/g.1018  ORF Transcript_778/g.1018 Transcript_778/m.1018 type:complete len:96 (-) Transcript_778:4-291(-)